MGNPTQNQLPYLLADIGGTHTRFAILMPSGDIRQIKVLKSADFDGLADAISAYADQITLPMPDHGVIGVAAPVMGDQIDMTNHHWSIDIDQVSDRLGFSHLSVINDFTALGYGAPRLSDKDLIPLQAGNVNKNGPIGVIGPGTGLGVATVIPVDGRHIVLDGEGGHVTLSPRDQNQADIITVLWQKYDHISAERVLSGDGLMNIYHACHQLSDSQPVHDTGQAITNDALGMENLQDPISMTAVHHFCHFLGVVSGNLALTIGATGGIYLAGGILHDILPILRRSDFIDYFTAKGRFSNFLTTIPIHLITHDFPAFIGLKEFIRQELNK